MEVQKERYTRIREISAEILSEYTEMDVKKIRELFCNEIGYQTPKVDVRGAIFKDNKILLVKEKESGEWSLPGGFAEYNLSVRENVEKEAFEEAGIRVQSQRIIAIHEKSKHYKEESPYGTYKIFVLCKLIDGEFKENVETEESGFFNLDNLPKLSTPRNTEKQVEMCFKAALEDGFEIEFD